MNAKADTNMNRITLKEGDEGYSNSRYKKPKAGLATAFKKLIGIYPSNKAGVIPLEVSDVEEAITTDKSGRTPNRSFMSYIPFKHYDGRYKQVVTENDERAVFLDIIPSDVEGLDQSNIDDIAEKVKLALDALPDEAEPWIIQVFQSDEDSRGLIHEIESYSKKHSEVDEYTESWLEILREHIQTISDRKGIFEDAKGMKWRSRYRRVRCVIYRKKHVEPEIINSQILRFTEALKEAGIISRRMSGQEIWKWLMPWYSGEKENAFDFIESVNYPEKEESEGTLPPSFDLGEMCLRNKSVKCNHKDKYWQLGNRLNRCLTLEPYYGVPKTGHWVLEGNTGITPFDRMPDGIVLAYTLIIDPQDKVEAQIELVKQNSIGDGYQSEQTKKECSRALKEMAKGNRLITFLSCIYIDADNLEELEHRTTKAIATANAAGFDVIEPVGENGDQLILDTFVRSLPMSFDPKLDKRYMKRARKAFDSHMARLLPFYTRGRGSHNHGVSFNSVGGEPVSFDPLGDDRSENGHLFLFGGTGAGKTTTLITMLMQLLGARNPRLYLITALPTYYLLGDYLESKGKSVHRVQITQESIPSLPPFADITKIITEESKFNDIEDVIDGRDYIGEAELAASLMITQGNENELKLYRVQDMALMKKAIIHAAETVVAEGRTCALTEDVVNALNELSKDEEQFPTLEEREKLARFSTIMSLYTHGIEGKLFNREGEVWPESDVTIVELGILARKGNEAKLAITVSGLMTMINHVVEKNQRSSSRNTITVIDEAHVLLKNPLTGPILNSIVAMWRTYGAWLWIATQKLDQIPESAKELINQPEWWIGLCLKDDEIEKVSKFRNLTNHEKKLLSSTRKEMYKYSEGGIISTNINTIVRIVPPPLTLALAFTEKEEKNQRYKLMEEQGITELEAVYQVAETISKNREAFDGE